MRKLDLARRLVFPFVAAIAASLLAVLAIGADAQEASTIDLVAVDVLTEGNDATTLGPLDGCLEANVDSEISIDVVVDAVPDDRPMIGFQMDVTYDQAILEVIDVDSGFLIASGGTYQPFAGLTDPLPDSDGTFTISVLDTSTNTGSDENMESGPGVISRVTFRTLTAGMSDVAIGYIPPDVVYPAILAPDGNTTQVDRIGAAVISVEGACPPDAAPVFTDLPPLEDILTPPVPTPVPADDIEEGGGVNGTLLVAAIALGVGGLVVLVGAGWLYRRLPRS